MRVLMVLVGFPALSESFVLYQITGLIDRGFDVDILAAEARKESTVHSDVAAYGLLDRVRNVHGIVPESLRLLRSTRILFALIRQGKPDLLKEAMPSGLHRMLKRPWLVGAHQLRAYGCIASPDSCFATSDRTASSWCGCARSSAPRGR
jgi:hypothetical protein